MFRIARTSFLFGSLSLIGLIPAVSPAFQAQAQQAQATVSGTVVDPDADLIPGATVTLTGPGGKAVTGTSGSDGTFTLKAAPGTYSFTVTMPGFGAFVRLGVKLAAGQSLPMNIKMSLESADQQVMVTADANTVSVDADSNASSTVIKGDDLNALSDDPDELSSELSALAGPSVGPNGGQIYIDGFTGGQLPPKSSIREIRINQNPFSAQYDRIGYGRVEVFTKPGTDKFHGSVQMQGNDNSFNTGNPLLLGTAIQPYHTIFFLGNVTGPLTKWASFTVSGSRRTIQDNAIIDPTNLYDEVASPGTLCLPGTVTGCTQDPNFTQAVLTPQLRWDISPRIDLALGEKNTLTARFQYTTNTQHNQGIGTNALFSTGYTTGTSETEIQMSDTQIVNSKVINETRFEYQRTPSYQTPFTTTPTFSVEGTFTGGGDAAGLSNVTDQHIEVQNYTSIALKHNFIRFGGRLRTTGESNTSTSGQNSTFTYDNIAAYVAGTPSQYSITNITNPTIHLRTTDVGLYAEDDWKARPNLTLSYGIRYEGQNYISDHLDFAPRTSLAWGVSKKTVIRLGYGIFFDRFLITNQDNPIRNNGVFQQNYVVQTPSAGCSPTTPAACLTGASTQTTITKIAPNLRAPYTMQTALGVDEQVFKNATVSVNFLSSRGTHQFNSENLNCLPYNPTTGCSTTGTTTFQYQSEGAFRQNQLILNMNWRAGRALQLFGFYAHNLMAKSNTQGINSFPTVPGDLSADYGRSSYDVRNKLFLGGSINMKYNIQASPFVVANSGTPYNLTTGIEDTTHDTNFDQRVAFATPGSAGSKTITGCGTFAEPTTGSTIVSPYYCSGPANFTMNLRLTKTFGFGPLTDAGRRQRGQNGGGPGGPGGGALAAAGNHGGGGGGGGRGGGGGGGGGFGGGGGTNTGHRYNLTLGAQGQNIFNIVDRGTPNGTFTSNKFGESQQLAGNIFTSTSAVRRVTIQATFTF